MCPDSEIDFAYGLDLIGRQLARIADILERMDQRESTHRESEEARNN